VKSFNQWYADAAKDTELVKAFTEWTTCSDDPIDADIINALTKGKNL
jgi:hypothetical protein